MLHLGEPRESRPPLLWETLQEGNLRLRQPQPSLVNMFFFFFSSISKTFTYLLVPVNDFVPTDISITSKTKPAVQGWDRATCDIPFQVKVSASTQLITTEVSIQSSFLATSAKCFCS